jgi:hypothetical protein
MNMPRYVILEHDHPTLHWDLMLECGDVLKTWRLAAAPARGQSVGAEPINDHRRQYLDYEGPVSGNRGQVKRWDWGDYQWETAAGFDGNGPWTLMLQGTRLRGRAVLARRPEGDWSFTVKG